MTRLRKLGMLNRAGMDSFNRGRMEDALFQLIQADQLAQSLESPLHQAKVRNNIGLVHQGAGDHEKAMACFRLAERNAVKVAGEGNVLHKAIIRNMAQLEADSAGQAA